MTTEELQQIKSAAVRIHEAAVAAGRWNSKPEWESKLMGIVCDISRAAERQNKHADLSMFDFYVPKAFDNKQPGEPFGTFEACFESFVQGSVEDCLADAVIDILDTVEGFCPDWDTDWKWTEIQKTTKTWETRRTFDADGNQTDELELFAMPDTGFVVTGYRLTYAVVSGGQCYHHDAPHLFIVPLFLITKVAEAHGVDLRRHVRLKMRYNETGR
ncbi:MAG: hypothetical protein LUC24_04695 [Bacteroidales bacterium]|nr:hypothetical protein [Bacteroidales bacterium]